MNLCCSIFSQDSFLEKNTRWLLDDSSDLGSENMSITGELNLIERLNNQFPRKVSLFQSRQNSSSEGNLGDLNDDLVVTVADFTVFLGEFGNTCDQPPICCLGDLNADGFITAADLTILMSVFGVVDPS